MQRNYVIIGNGIAGLTAAEQVRSCDPSGKVTLISDEPHGFYSRPGLAYVLNGQIPEEQIFSRPFEEISRLGVEMRVARVSGVDPAQHTVKFAEGGTLSYDALLLAVGARAVRPNIEGIEMPGVVTLDNLDDLRAILKLSRRTKSAVVIGGGITALELAEGLAARKVQTHYLLRGERYWRGILDPEESRYVEERLLEEGVQLHHNTEVRRILAKRGRVAGVETLDGRCLECQILAVAIGIRPRLELAGCAQLLVDRGILVDEMLRTSVSGIYAAGDVAQVYDPVSGQHRLDSLWWVAKEQGAVAGRNMTGASLVYRKPVAFNVTRIGGLTTTIIGAVGQAQADEDLVAIARGDSETWRDPAGAIAAEDRTEGNRLRLLIGARHIVGALVMGDQSLSRPLQDLIANRVDISPQREDLLNPSGSPALAILDIWKKWRLAPHAGKS